MADEIARCRAAGMNDHLAKPIDREILLAAVARWSGQAAIALSARRTPDEPVLNEAILGELEKELGRPKLLVVTALFREQLGKALDVIAATSDRRLLASEAHNLVALAGNLGCSELMARVRGLVGALPDQAVDIEPLIAGIAGAARRALSAIDARYLA
jgi:CheY-like chemotaxis protein